MPRCPVHCYSIRVVLSSTGVWSCLLVCPICDPGSASVYPMHADASMLADATEGRLRTWSASDNVHSPGKLLVHLLVV